MCLAPDHFRPKVFDRLCSGIIEPVGVCSGHSGKERSEAVN